ncbi:DUF1080 domain-containing protein [Acidobacteriota bacterium]
MRVQKLLFHLRRHKNFIYLFPILLLISACGQDKSTLSESSPALELNTLTAEEKEAGWELLFDGTTFNGWRGVGLENIPEGHWTIEDGVIKKIPSGEVPLQEDGQPLEGGDIMTTKTFENFELYLEWKIVPAGNSGIKYNVSEDLSVSNPPPHGALGFEYQILDDNLHPDGQRGGLYTASALYDLVEPLGKTLKPVGEFNSTRILLKDHHGEHWLNGTKVLEYEMDTEEFKSLVAKSKYKDYEGFADKRSGHIIIQDHTSAAWFRNIKIRKIK